MGNCDKIKEIKKRSKEMEKIYNITIDGPAGSGKTTISKMVAEALNITYLDTGAMYRAIACYVKSKKVDFNDTDTIVKLLDEIDLKVELNQGEQKTSINGKVYGEELRAHDISNGASIVCKIPAIRLKMVDLQREIARKYSCTLDGRDIGSFVLPDAEFKFYLTADVDTRAKRRWLQLKDKMDVTIEQVKADLIERDERDSSRELAPLCVPKNAFVLDTTNLNQEEVMSIILEEVKKG
ncbi:MAG: (d)CMP kinase [Clostridiales bacterium]|nr:(d)CMP kinase [Clostridiales bacterium]